MRFVCICSLPLLHSAGALLKEAIEDLEWTAIGSNNSSVEVCMQRQPRRLFFSAQAAGSLQVSCKTYHVQYPNAEA